MRLRTPPKLETLLKPTAVGEQPVAIVLAGHNGSGKSTLWYERLADKVQMPLVNADRLTLSLLPEPGTDRKLRPWVSRLRDEDERWQKLAQDGVRRDASFQQDPDLVKIAGIWLRNVAPR